MLHLIHESKMGAEKCKARSRTVMYWPGMSKDIEHEVFKCSVCMKHQKSQQREPMKLAMDIMTYHGPDFLVVVDNYWKYSEISQLPDKTAKTTITHTNSICSRHRILEQIVSDNMPFRSREFKDFAHEWGKKTTTSRPTYEQSNGQAERFVQTLKGLLKKADEEGRDPYIASYRLLRSKPPKKQSLLQPKMVQAHDDLTRRQQRQKLYYDKRASPMQKLSPGDIVRGQRGKVWEPACAHVNPRSYLVQSQHGQLRRNRRHLSKTNELPPVYLPAVETSSVEHPLTTPCVDAPQLREVPAAPREPADTQETLVTHDRVTSRIIKTPARYR